MTARPLHPRDRRPLLVAALALLGLLVPAAAAAQQRATPDPMPPGDPAAVHAAVSGQDGDGAADAPADGDDGPPDMSGIMSLAEFSPPRGLRLNGEGAFPGYTLFGPLNSHTIRLVDMEGETVHSWECDSAPGAWCYLLDDGTLLRLGREDEDPQFKGGGIGGRIQRLAPDGTVLWHWQLASADRQQHHDVEPLPNGNLLVIAWERKDGREAVARGRDPRATHRTRGFWPDVVYEVKPVGTDDAEIVWEWHAWDHLVQDVDDSMPDHGLIARRPERIDINGDHRDQPPMTAAELKEAEELEEQLRALGYVGGADDDEEDPDKNPGDWLHTNGVSYHPEYDLIALSTPHFSEIWVIDHSTTTEEARGSTGGRWGHGGDLLWRWGNPRRHGAGSDDDQHLQYQHDPTWQTGPDGSLRLLLFNNGRDRVDGSSYSSVEELVLPFDPATGFRIGADGRYGPDEPVWTYSDGDQFYSAFVSGAQRLPNGNTLICSGVPGRIFEVTRDGEVVWDYRNPHGGEIDPPEHAGRAPPLALFRATRLAPDHPGIVALLGE